MGSIFRNLFRKKSKSGKSSHGGPHTPPIPTPNHPRPPAASAAKAAPKHPLTPVPEDGTVITRSRPGLAKAAESHHDDPNAFDDDDGDDDRTATHSTLSTSPYTMASAAASLRSVASVATLRPDPRAQLSSDDEFMSSDDDESGSDRDESRRERERKKRKKEKKAGKKHKSSSKKSKRKEAETMGDHPPKVRKAGSSASGSTASVSVAGSGSTRGSSTSGHPHQRSRQGSVASGSHAHHRPPTPPLGSAYDGPSSSSDDDDRAPVALDPMLIARSRLGSASSTHLPFHPPSWSASPALAAGHYYQGYPSPGLTNSSAAGSRRGSPAGLLGLAPAPLSPMHPNFHAHHTAVTPQPLMSSPLVPGGGMRGPVPTGNLAYAPLVGMHGMPPPAMGLRPSPSMTSLHSAYTAGGGGLGSRSASPMIGTHHPAYTAAAAAGPMLRASPSMTSLHSAYTSGAVPRGPAAATAHLGPTSRFAFPPTASAGNTPMASPMDLRGGGPRGVAESDSEEDEVLGLRAMRAGRGGYFLNGNGSAPASPARSRAGSNASSVLTAGMTAMSLGPPAAAAVPAATEGGDAGGGRRDKKSSGKHGKKKEKRDKEGKKKKTAGAAGADPSSDKPMAASSSSKNPVAAPSTFYGASPHLPQGTMAGFGPGTFVPLPSPASTSASSDQSSTGSRHAYRRGGGPQLTAPIGGARGY